MGWSNPAGGIDYLFSRPALVEELNDDTVHPINEVWGRDGYLRYYVERAHRGSQTFHTAERSSSGAFEMEDETEEYSRHSPVELHLESYLSGHYFRDEGQPDFEPAQVLKFDVGARTATVLVESAWGWYEALSRAGEKLRELGGVELSIDVYVKPIGYRGTFQQSPVTSLWFTCSHDIHMIGN